MGVASFDQKPTEFWLNSKGWLTDAETNGALRHAYAPSDKLKAKPIAAAIGMNQVDNGNDWLHPGAPVWLRWEITSDDLLIPAGSLQGLSWVYCQNGNPPDNPSSDINLGGRLGVGNSFTESNCTTIQGLKVTKID